MTHIVKSSTNIVYFDLSNQYCMMSKYIVCAMKSLINLMYKAFIYIYNVYV